jgi:hypothetical protein
MVEGTVLSRKTFVRIQWEWLALLAFQVAAAGIFLVVTAVYTHSVKAQVLRNTSLAMLVALDNECREVAGGIDSVAFLKKAIRPIWARWVDHRIVIIDTKVHTKAKAYETGRSVYV